jgi:hypothetical protein
MVHKKIGNPSEEKSCHTFLLRNTSARNQEIPDHLFCFALEGMKKG